MLQSSIVKDNIATLLAYNTGPSKGFYSENIKYTSSSSLGAVLQKTSTPLPEKIFYELNRLNTKYLKEPLLVCIEKDGEGYLAQTHALPLFGFGNTIQEAIKNLCIEIESLHEELLYEEDNNLTQEWQNIKNFLLTIVI